MHSSGDAFVDARRCDAIKYIFRNKQNLLEDLKKARHCIEAAISKLESSSSQKELSEDQPRGLPHKVNLKALAPLLT